jgi:hypothetical protein
MPVAEAWMRARPPAANMCSHGTATPRQAKAEARRETLRDKLARELEEHADEIVAAYLAGIRSDDPTAPTGLQTPGSLGFMVGRKRQLRMWPQMTLST